MKRYLYGGVETLVQLGSGVVGEWLFTVTPNSNMFYLRFKTHLKVSLNPIHFCGRVDQMFAVINTDQLLYSSESSCNPPAGLYTVFDLINTLRFFKKTLRFFKITGKICGKIYIYLLRLHF